MKEFWSELFKTFGWGLAGLLCVPLLVVLSPVWIPLLVILAVGIYVRDELGY